MSRHKVHFHIPMLGDNVCQGGSKTYPNWTTDPREVNCRNCIRELPPKRSKAFKHLVDHYNGVCEHYK